MAFDITQELGDEVVKMTLSGELDAASAPRFVAELEKAATRKPKQLVLFLAELTYIASAGVRALIFATQRNRPGVDVYVIAPTEQVVDTLQRTGLYNSVIIQDEYRALK